MAAGGLNGGMGKGGIGQSAASQDGGVQDGGDSRVAAGGAGDSAPCAGGTAAGGEAGQAVGGGGGEVLSGRRESRGWDAVGSGGSGTMCCCRGISGFRTSGAARVFFFARLRQDKQKLGCVHVRSTHKQQWTRASCDETSRAVLLLVTLAYHSLNLPVALMKTSTFCFTSLRVPLTVCDAGDTSSVESFVPSSASASSSPTELQILCKTQHAII